MVNDPRKEMNRHLSELVIPVLRQQGFKGTFPHFRRITNERIHLLTFQFDKYGGGFVIEIANCKPGGYTTSWGKHIEPNKLTAHNLNKRKRIQANMKTEDSGTGDWFRYDSKYLFGFGNTYKKVCREVLANLRYADDFWKNGECEG